MIVTVAWLVLGITAVVCELLCRRSGGRWASLGAIGSAVGSRVPGSIVLIALWAFVGWHVFARYTIPR